MATDYGDVVRPASPLEPPRTAWVFPPPERWAADDLVAMGADLEPGTLLTAYRSGVFPMPIAEGPMAWFSPVRRGVLPLDGVRVSRSLRRSCRDYVVTVDTAFDAVMAGCADPTRTGSWIDNPIREAYQRLHDLGWAHRVEVWYDGTLAGGLYGVEIGGLFAGESMFHRRRDASKVALVALVERLRGNGSASAVEGRLLDVQWASPHLASLGAITLARADYLARLARALVLPPSDWSGS